MQGDGQRRPRRLRPVFAAVLITALVVVGPHAAGGQINEQAGQLIDFEDLPYETSREGIPSIPSVEVTDFYRDRGVTFDPPVLGLRVDAQLLERASFAHSGSGFIAPLCPRSLIAPEAALVPGFCRPVAMVFDTEMSTVAVFVGAAPANENRTLTLEALDANGDPMASDAVDFPETGDFTPMSTPLTVSVPEGGVFGARLYWIGGSTTAFFVDDLGLTPFVGTPEIEASESGIELFGTVGTEVPATSTATVAFANVGTGASVNHRIRLVAPEPFDGVLRLDTTECADPLDRGASCVVGVILDTAAFPIDEAGEYSGGAELWFENPGGDVLEAVDLSVTVVVDGSEQATGNETSDDRQTTATTASADDGSAQPRRNRDNGTETPWWAWLLVVVGLGAMIMAARSAVRRLRRVAAGRRPAPSPPPPSPPPPTSPYRITIRNTGGEQHLIERNGPLVIITATRPPGRVEISEGDEDGDLSPVSVEESDAP